MLPSLAMACPCPVAFMVLMVNAPKVSPILSVKFYICSASLIHNVLIAFFNFGQNFMIISRKEENLVRSLGHRYHQIQKVYLLIYLTIYIPLY